MFRQSATTYVMICLLLSTFVFAQEPWGALALPQGDGAPLNEDEAQRFGGAICAADSLLPYYEQDEPCDVYMDDEPYSPYVWFGLGFSLDVVFYGSFSKVGVQEVVLRLFQLETDAGVTASVLFRRDGTQWRPVYGLDNALRQTSLTFPTDSGETLIIGYGEGFETAAFDLQVTHFGEEGAETSLLMDYVNPFPIGFTAAPGARFAEVVGWARRDVNGDGHLDLVLDVNIVRLDQFDRDAENVMDAFYEAVERRDEVQEVAFLFDGESFRPSLEARELMRYSQEEQGWVGRH